MLWLSGCHLPLWAADAEQSVVRPVSEQAEGIYYIWWAMFWVAVIVFCFVMGVLFVGLIRQRGRPARRLSYVASRNLVIGAGVALPLLTVAFLVGGSLMLGRQISAQPPENALTIRVTGWMWWWQIDYLDGEGRVVATTANEMHVPVGRPVHLLLESQDVIHSFWVPQLHGKTDMIPGRTNTSWFTPTQPGVFRGQCAEFCGREHALMAFLVVAEPADQFSSWLENQRHSAREPRSSAEQRGQDVFFAKGCQDCHSIRGTEASGETAPDLTHFASRQTLAAVTRKSSRGHLAGWIADPQAIKPGAKMPRTLFESQEFLDLLSYLESLE